MKFGETLSLRSVPQWQNFNLDYTSIKQLIKEDAASGTGKPVAIPGKCDAVSAAFEEQVFDILTKEHNRLSLFAKSKTYEINSRLGSIDNQLSSIRQKQQGSQSSRHGIIRTKKRLLAVETEILKVGQEIQNLSRFIAINRQAIQKLITKYQKWTNSTTLGPMVENRLLQRHDSFVEVKMEPLLLRYTDYLDALRAPFEQNDQLPVDVKPSTALNDNELVRIYSGASSVSQICEYGPSGMISSNVDFDFALRHGSSDSHINEAVYWIHKDNTVELRILLLQYLRYAKIPSTGRSSTTGRESVKAYKSEKEDIFGSLVFESGKQSSMSSHNKVNKPNVTACWSGSDDAIVCIPNQQRQTKSEPKRIRRAKDSLGSLAELLNSKTPFASDASVEGFSNDTDIDSAETFRQHLQDLLPVECIAEITSQRSRFVGLENSNNQNEQIWAALDESLTFYPVTNDSLKNMDLMENTHQNSTGVRLPHAVLTVRVESRIDELPGLIGVLDESHLTERVCDYSPEVHVMTLFSAQSPHAERPEWVSRLDKDIRQIPKQSAERTTSNNSSPSLNSSLRRHLDCRSGSLNEASESTPLTVDSGPAEYIINNQVASSRGARIHKIREKHMRQEIGSSEKSVNKDRDHAMNSGSIAAQLQRQAVKPSKTKQTEQVRYWNEYDYPPSSVGRNFIAGEEAEQMDSLQKHHSSQGLHEPDRLGKWLLNLLGLRQSHSHDYAYNDLEAAASTSSSEDGTAMATTETAPILRQQSRSKVMYDTFPSFSQQKRKHQSVFLSIWFVLFSVGVSLEVACAISISGSSFSSIDDETVDDGVLTALLIMGIMTGCLLIGVGLYGSLRLWQQKVLTEKAMAEQSRLGKQKERRFG